MSTEIAPMQAFTEKLHDKLRNDIAGMLPDEVIKAMIEKATHSLFFDRAKQNTGSDYAPRWIEKPSAFEVMVMETVKPIIEKGVGEAIAANHQVIADTIKDVIEKGMANLAIQTLSDIMTSVMVGQGQSYTFQNSVMQALRSRGFNVPIG